MNEANYASLEASKRLIEKGIRIETEKCWVYSRHIQLDGVDLIWKLFDRGSLIAIETTVQRPASIFPAPSMAEVWRELTDEELLDVTIARVPFTQETLVRKAIHGEYQGKYPSTRFERFLSANPTNALIELLIWQKEQTNER